ncbi:MAG: hypothetical protein AABW79_03990 [Nanoarchaeota archaeon]
MKKTSTRKSSVKKKVNKKVEAQEEFDELDEGEIEEESDFGSEISGKISSLDNRILDKVIELVRVKIDLSAPRREKIEVLLKQRPEKLRQALILINEESFDSKEEDNY